MTGEISRMIVVPVDGYGSARKSIDYIHSLFGPAHPLKITLLCVVPIYSLAQCGGSAVPRETLQRIDMANAKAAAAAKKTLASAKKALIEKGFGEHQITIVHQDRKEGIARDICAFSENAMADGILISTMGRSRLEAFLIGETANKVLELSRISPVWLLKGSVTAKGVLIAMDASEGALRGVDHAGFMLAGTDCPVTLFYTKRHFWRFLPGDMIAETPELESFCQQEAVKKIEPYMSKAREILRTAGLADQRISVRIVNGSRNAARDILRAAEDLDCGTIVLGRRGLTGVRSYTLGSVSRKVLESAVDKALWMVS